MLELLLLLVLLLLAAVARGPLPDVSAEHLVGRVAETVGAIVRVPGPPVSVHSLQIRRAVIQLDSRAFYSVCRFRVMESKGSLHPVVCVPSTPMFNLRDSPRPPRPSLAPAQSIKPRHMNCAALCSRPARQRGKNF